MCRERLLDMKFRIQFKLPTQEDMQYIRWFWSDPESMELVGGPVIHTDDQVEPWYEYMVEPGQPTNCYRLVIKEAEAPMGEVSFHQLDPDAMTAMFNLKRTSRECGKGYGREAMRYSWITSSMSWRAG